MPIFEHFTLDEFACKCGCGTNKIRPTFIHRLDVLRSRCGFPLVITSGYRCKDHPVEAAKEKPGRHNSGSAADIKVASGNQRYILQKHAYAMNFRGIGPAKGFVHVDDRPTTPVSWVY